MITDRPCVCGCMFEDHAELKFEGNKESVYYCRIHTVKPGFFCISYTPIDNLKFLEWKDKNGNS